MKHFVAMLAVVFMLLSTTSFATNSEEILFRDIPWGITLDQYVFELEKQGFVISSVDMDSFTATYRLPRSCKGLGCAVVFGDDDNGSICTVAGHDVCSIIVLSVCNVEDGVINLDFKDSIVYSAAYIFSDYMELLPYEDLFMSTFKEKLSLLYGEASTILDEIYVWHGEDDTEVKLDFAMIQYTDNSIDRHIEELEKAVYSSSEALDGL